MNLVYLPLLGVFLVCFMLGYALYTSYFVEIPAYKEFCESQNMGYGFRECIEVTENTIIKHKINLFEGKVYWQKEVD